MLDRMIAYSDYHLQLAQYQPWFSVEQFLLIDFETLRESPDSVIRSVEPFLALEPRRGVSSVGLHRNPTPDQPAAEAWLRRVTDRFGLRQRVLQSIRRVLVWPMRKTPSRPWRLSSEQRRYVFKQLEPGMEKLRSEFGVATDQWGFGAGLKKADGEEATGSWVPRIPCGERNGE